MRKLFASQSVQDGLLTNQSTVSRGGGGGGSKLWTLYSFPHPACVAESLQTEYKDKRMGRTPPPSGITAAWLAQLGERRSAEREVAGSNPGRTNTQGL